MGRTASDYASRKPRPIKTSMAPTMMAVPLLSPIKMQIAAVNDQTMIGRATEEDSGPVCRTNTDIDALLTDRNAVAASSRPKLN